MILINFGYLRIKKIFVISLQTDLMSHMNRVSVKEFHNCLSYELHTTLKTEVD